VDKQALYSKMLTTLAEMRHQRLKEVAESLPDEEEAADSEPGESQRKRRKKGAGS
jgi:hypothetical protein